MKRVYQLFLLLAACLLTSNSFAEEEKVAAIKLLFDKTDSTRTCKAIVTSNGLPVKEIEVHFYVKRTYSLLPIEKAVETDSAGTALVSFPLDLPGDKSGKIIVVAKIEDDDNYGSVETQDEVKWGIKPVLGENTWGNRSLSASRDKAPMTLIVVSNLIIALIWGTIFYVILQIFKIIKASKMLKSNEK